MATRSVWTFRRGDVWAAELTGRRVRDLRPRVRTEFAEVLAAHFPRLLAAVQQMDPISPDALAKRFELGRQCFAAWVDDSVAAYAWLTRGAEWIGEFERRLEVAEGEAYIWDCATVPAYRRRRLFSALISHVADELSREGLQRLWIISRMDAAPVNRAVERAGYTRITRLIYLRIGGYKFLAVTPGTDVSRAQVCAARRLLGAEGERTLGPLLVGNTARREPPETHHGGWAG